MRPQRRVLVGMALALASCSSVAAPTPDLAQLKGQPIQPVVAKLGPPASELKTDGGTRYAWTIESRVEAVERTTTTEYATGRPNAVGTTALVPKRQSCTLRLLVDGGGVITAVEQDGPYPACSAVAAKLKDER
jgi:hypothetical protein